MEENDGTRLEDRGRKSRAVAVWLIYAILTNVCWGVWGFLVKVGSDSTSPFQTQILFTLGMLPLALAALIQLKLKVDADPRGLIYGMLTGVFTVLGLLAFYAAMAKGKASVVGPVTGLFPLLTVILAVLLLKERMNRFQVIGSVLAIVSILILSG